jgi:hypothetical protein
VNGGPLEAAPGPGSWLVIRRAWKNGDTIDVSFPFSLRAEGFADNPDRFAILNGPLVLCARGEQGQPFFAVAAGRDEVLKALEPAGGPGRFSATGETFRAAGGGAALRLEPFFAMHGGQSYQVYFDRLTAPQWQAKQSEAAAELARQRDLAARTVDYVAPDRGPGERAHAMRGERTAGGDFSDRQWRHATEGGWFSWDLKVLPDTAQELRVTYWGSDAGNRVFDLLVDGQKLATQRLEQNKPGQFYEEVYKLPAELLRDKARLTIKFQAHAGAMAGGVFGVRLVKQQPDKQGNQD